MRDSALAFILCAPRSGSTLLQRMIASHSAVITHPEPHLLTPLYHLGYYATVDAAPYDHINAAQALREFADELHRGEEDYLDALRAYAKTLYGSVLKAHAGEIFLDKTPAYGLIASFVTKLFPGARLVVLTRHPMAIWHSQAYSFFGGDYRLALEQNPLVEPYVESLGSFLVKNPDVVHLRYEDLVACPEDEMRRVLDDWGLEFEEACVEYGRVSHITKSYGDPMSVERHSRPVTDSLNTWAKDLNSRPEALALARRVVARLDPEHLAAWGYPTDEFWAALDSADARSTTRFTRFNSYWVKRQILLRLRKNVGDNVLGNAVRRVRYYCDVVLRS